LTRRACTARVYGGLLCKVSVGTRNAVHPDMVLFYPKIQNGQNLALLSPICRHFAAVWPDLAPHRRSGPKNSAEKRPCGTMCRGFCPSYSCCGVLSTGLAIRSKMRNAQRLRVLLPPLHIGAVVASPYRHWLCACRLQFLGLPLTSCRCCASRFVKQVLRSAARARSCHHATVECDKDRNRDCSADISALIFLSTIPGSSLGPLASRDKGRGEGSPVHKVVDLFFRGFSISRLSCFSAAFPCFRSVLQIRALSQPAQDWLRMRLELA
jgi:hypothetical protein